ncbi:MAG: hypothetical protein JXB39_07640 [Deltaproteobacteria bacterium]|nr:hypothetical protein [Deltaproteobacteria bacterium]
MRPIALVVLALAATACGSDEDPCISGTWWEDGNQGSDLMNPGRDCILCHDRSGGPSFDIAGTVYEDPREPDDCFGVDGAKIRIIDADASVWELESNAAGNFFHEAEGSTIDLPILATVVTATGERPMVTAQDSGSCNSCHTVRGLRGAQGRVTVP